MNVRNAPTKAGGYAVGVGGWGGVGGGGGRGGRREDLELGRWCNA